MGLTKHNLETAVGEVVKITTGSLKDSDGSDIKCDKYLTITIAGTSYYIPLYDTTA